MRLKINIRLRKALMACFAALAASCFTINAHAAENDNFDSLIFEVDSVFSDESYYNSTWVGASLVGGQFDGTENEINLSQSDFTNANLTSASMLYVDASGSNFTNTNFTNAGFSLVDFRGANLTNANFTGASMEACDFRGAILTDAQNFSLTNVNNRHNNINSLGYLQFSAYKDILIRDIYYATPTAAGLNVKLSNSGYMGSSSDLFIEQGGQLEITGFVTVTLGSNHTTIIEANDTAPTSLLLRSNANLIIDERANIKIVDNSKLQEGANINFTFLDVEDSTTLTASNLGGVLRFNGATLSMANLTLVQTGTSYSIVGQVNYNYDGMDLSSTYLSGTHFANYTSWNNTILSEALLEECIFDGVALLGTNFSDSALLKSQFKGITSATGANFNGARFSNALIDSSNFEGADFSKAHFSSSILSQSSFRGANFTSAHFDDADLTGSDITDAIITGANFYESLGGTGITHAQLLSTKNGQEKDYTNIYFLKSDLEGFDFSEATLRGVYFNETKLKGAQFEGADISQVHFYSVINSNNMTIVMLASTANAQAKNFSDIKFNFAELAGYDFTGYQLRDASFFSSDFDGTIFTGSYIQGSTFFGCANLSQKQLESTASYAERDFSQLNIQSFDFTNFDFSGMNLSQSNLQSTNMQGADLSNADLRLSIINSIQNLDLSTHKNLINTNGEVLNVELNSLDDRLSVRGPVGDGVSGEVYVTLKQATTISGEATLEVLSGGALKLQGAALTLTSTGNLLITAPNHADSALMLTEGSSLTLESGAFIDITLADAFFAPGYSFDLLSVDSSSTLLELDALAARLRINDKTLDEAGFELSLFNGTYKLSSYAKPSDGDCIWLGDNSNIWNNSALNWKDGELPSELASVYLTNEGSGAVELDGTKTVKAIYVQDKNYTLSGSELNVGTLSIAEGLILSLENIEVNISSQLDAAKGVITTNNTLTLEGGQAHQLGAISSSADSEFYLKGDTALLINQVLGGELLHIGENAQMAVTGYLYMGTSSITNNGTLTLKDTDTTDVSALKELNGTGKLIMEDNVELQLGELTLKDIKMGENSFIYLNSTAAEIEFEQFESKGTLTSLNNSHLIFNAAVAVGGSVEASELTITAPSHFNSLTTDTLHINTTLSADTVALSVTSLQGKTDSQTLSLGLSGLSEHTTDGSYLILSKEDETALNFSYTTQLQATLDAILADERTYSFDWNESLTELRLSIHSGDLTTWKTADDFAAKYNSETGQQFEGTTVVLFADASTGQISSFAAFESVKAIEVNANALIDLGLSGEGVLALNNLSGESGFTLTLKNGAASLNNNKATTLNGNLEAEGMELSVNNSADTALSVNKLTLENSSLHLTADSALSLSYLTAYEQGSIKNEGSLTITESATISALRESTGTLTLTENALVNITGEYDNTGLVTIGSNATMLLGSAFTTWQTIELGDVNNSGTIDAGINLLNISATLTKSGSIKAEHFYITSDNTFESLNVGTTIQIYADVTVEINQLSTDNENGAELGNGGTLSLSEVSGAFSIGDNGKTTILANRQIELQSITQKNIVVEAGATLTLNELSTIDSLSGEGTLISKGSLLVNYGGSSIGHLRVDELSLNLLTNTSSFLSTESISSYTEGQSITLDLTSHFSSLGEGSYSIIAAENLSWDMFEWSDFAQWQFDTLVANGRLYEFVESSAGLSIEITLATGVHNLWYTSNNFAAKYNSEGEMYPSTEIPLLDAQGNITSYAAFDSVDNVYVDASLSLDLSTIDTGVAATDELTLKHLSATDAEVTLSLLGEGKDLDTALLLNEYNSTMQGKLKADGVSLIVSNGEHIVLSVNELELTESRLSVSADSQLALGKLEGDGRSVIGGDIAIYGEGGTYYGGYENAHVSIVGEDTNQTLLTGDGLHISGSEGKVTLIAPQHGRAIHSLGSLTNTGTSLDLRAFKGQTIGLSKASSMEGGTLSLSINAPTLGMSTIFEGEALTLSKLNVEVYAAEQYVLDEIKAQGSGNYTLFAFGDNTTLGEGVEIDFMGELAKYVSSWTLNADTHSIDVEIRTDFYADVNYSGNGLAGGLLIIDMDANHKPSGELEDAMNAVLELIDVKDETGANNLAAAIAGASVTSLGSAQIGTLEARLQSLRSQDNSQLKKGEGHAWIAAEGSFNELSQDATMAGHSLNTWGGSVGGAWAVSENCQVTASLTALYGDLDAKSVDSATGELDSYYLAAGVQLTQGKWQHRFVATMGLSDASLERTVSYEAAAYRTEGDTSGFALGLMYELSYEIALDEQEESVLEPLINLSFISSSLEGYTEQGGSGALKVGEQENSYLSVGIGARYKQQVNASLSYNAHALVRFDAGDRQSEASVSFADVDGTQATVQGAEPGAIGIELGAGASYALDEQSALFINAGIDLRGEYSNVNATIGYRLSF